MKRAREFSMALLLLISFSTCPCAQDQKPVVPPQEASCSDKYQSDAVAVLTKFIAESSPASAKKFATIFSKCNPKNNDLLLDFLSEAKTQFDQNRHDDKERENTLRLQIDRDFQVQMILLEKPIDDKALLKLVTELFDLVQQTKRFEIEDAEKELVELKQKYQERERRKVQIIERRIQLLKGPDPLEWN